MKTIVISSDHNGVGDKEQLKTYLKGEGYQVIDIGPFNSEVSVDYVDYAAQLSTIVSNKEADRGILLCGTGVGMSIVANRFPGVRAVLAHAARARVQEGGVAGFGVARRRERMASLRRFAVGPVRAS